MSAIKGILSWHFCFIIILLITAGCMRSSAHKPFSQPKFNLQDVTEGFKALGFTLVKDKESNDWTLNGVKPNVYKFPNGERFAIYIYAAGESRAKGLENFNLKKAKYDMAVPIVFEVRNVLMFYWYRGITGSPTEYDETIKKVITGIDRKKPLRID
jgi:hypothetical protein